ncbi:MAG: helix-turn-helix domain-containing protein [Planctomycetota bacterium]
MDQSEEQEFEGLRRAAARIQPPYILFSEDLAEVFKISVESARRRLRQGQFGPRFKSGRKWAVLRKSLEAHLEGLAELPEQPRRRSPVPKASPEIIRFLKGKNLDGRKNR